MTETMALFIPDLVVCTRYHDEHGNLFRGDPDFMGRPWRDWVWIDWGDDGVLPNKIWGFVDLRLLPKENDLRCGGLHGIYPTFYAIVESADVVKKKNVANRSELFVPILKSVGTNRQGDVNSLEFYLADTHAFDGKAVVIPDVGGPPNGYFLLRPRGKWREDFVRWLERKYEDYDDDSENSGDSTEVSED